jgi:response regulator NasT
VVIAEDEALIRMDLAEMLAEEGYDVVGQARDAGAMAYLVKPFQRSDLVPAIEMAVSRFGEIAVLEREVEDLQEALATRKAVDRAKGVLQERLGLGEADAFRWIQKTAMDLRLSMRQVAEGVVEHGPGTDQTSAER